MDKMKMETANKTLEKLEILKEMFPEVITETKDANGDIVSAVDAKKLEQLLSTKVIEGDEAYDFTWVGKKQAMVEANRPIRKTLRPCKEESVDWENTKNLYIEGDNLDVLKLLQESYLNKIKMIYIDPPYNTGNDSFIYPDDYTINKDKYDEEVGAIDESGYRMFKNTETNGRFHSSWCSMMYPRLKLARNLLSEDGIIFISIDDHEVDSLKKMCNEVFGETNCIGYIARATGTTTGQDANKIGSSLDYLLCYTKSNLFELQGIELSDDDLNRFKEKDEKGAYSYLQLRKTGNADRREDRPLMYYPVISPNGDEVYPIGPTGYQSRWRVAKNTYEELCKNNMILWKDNRDGILQPYVKYYAEGRTKQVSNLWNDIDGNKKGSIELKQTIGEKVFDNPKPISFIRKIMNISKVNNSDIILDFFSGSATTAHAVMQLNAEDGGKRKFIMVQLPEVCDEKSEAYKAGYTNICEIGKERIRRAGNKIKEETGKHDLDIGFRVLKLDESNMKDVYYAPADYNQSMLDRMTSNIKEDRTSEDLLYACMLEWGLELSLPHKVENIAGFNVHIVNDGDLIACFENKISEEAIKQIADKNPLRAVFRDSSFASDASRVNVGEIFKLKSPNTTIKVI